MAEGGSFLPEWLTKWLKRGDERLFEEGEKAIDAAKGSGQRAIEAQQKAAEEARRRLEEEIKKFEREGGDPNKIRELRKMIDYYKRLRGK